MNKLELKVEGMVCTGCENRLKNAILQMKNVKNVEASFVEKSGELYQAYRSYCLQNGEFTRSTTDFYAALDKAGFRRFRKSTGVKVYGLRLKEGQDFLG